MYECNSTVAFWRPGPNSASLEFLFSSNGSPEYNPMLLFLKKKSIMVYLFLLFLLLVVSTEKFFLPFHERASEKNPVHSPI